MIQPSPRRLILELSIPPAKNPFLFFVLFAALSLAIVPAYCFAASSQLPLAHAVNLLLLFVVALALASIVRLRPSTRTLLAHFFLLALIPLPATAAVRKKPARPSSKSTHTAPLRHAAPGIKPGRTTLKYGHPRKSKPGQAQPQSRLGPRIPPPYSASAYPAPENAIATTESTRTQLAEAPISPFYNSQALVPFFRALAGQQASLRGANSQPDSNVATPNSATVRILQFGDSHTAADLFTGDLRAQLQSRFGNGGLGFQYPGHPFPGYHLAGSSRSQSSGWLTEGNRFTQLGDGYLGLGGISISTSRPGESISLGTTCATLQVQYLRQPEGGRLRLVDNGVFISDIDTGGGEQSASAGPSGYSPAEPAIPTRSAGTITYACSPGEHSFELTTLDYAPVRLLGLVTEQPGITYECLGINGAVATLMLRWNQALFGEYLRQRDPALIVLAYGTNEAAQSPGANEDYVFQFRQLLQNLHRIVPSAAILVLGPYDRALKSGRGRRAAWHTFGGTERIIVDQREACHLYNCAFYDERTRMGGPGAMIRWVSAGLAQSDRTHLTGPGYRALAEALFRDLMAAYAAFQQNNTAPLASVPSQTVHARSFGPSDLQ